MFLPIDLAGQSGPSVRPGGGTASAHSQCRRPSHAQRPHSLALTRARAQSARLRALLHWRAGARGNLASPRPTEQRRERADRHTPTAPIARERARALTKQYYKTGRVFVLCVWGIGLAGRRWKRGGRARGAPGGGRRPRAVLARPQTWNVTARCARAGRDREIERESRGRRRLPPAAGAATAGSATSRSVHLIADARQVIA